MRRLFSLGLAFAVALTAMLAIGFLAATLVAAEERMAPVASEIRLREAADTEPASPRITERAAAKQPAAPPAKPAGKVPTPAKRRPNTNLTPVDAGASQLVPPPAAARTAITAPKADSPAELLQPIADPMEIEPQPAEVASFKGVTPGQSTREDVQRAWGKPLQIRRTGGDPVELYSVLPFKRVELHYNGVTISSIVIRLDRAFSADAAAKQLDLATIRPAVVLNDTGEVLGQSYPERGVLFAFEPGSEPGKASMKVVQIILEPIAAESFVLRAESTLETRPDLSRRDLEQAIKLDAASGRSHWLLARALASGEKHDRAVAAATEAVRLDPDDAQFRVTHAQTLAEVGRLSEATSEARKAVEISGNRPHVKARATCLVGDLLASGAKPDFQKALTFHTQAIQLADSLTTDPHPAIRVAAKEVLVDAHLGAAHDIAWGEWKEKPKAVQKWLERAVTVADDLVNSEGVGEDRLFHVYTRAVAAYVGVRGGIDPAPTAKAAVEIGEKLVGEARTPERKTRLQWELGMALYDAVQISQMRTDHDAALKYGEIAAEYLVKANETRPSASSSYLLGRLYFRLGTIHAMREHDHKAAVAWFDKAVPLLERPSPEDLAPDLGRHGESFVSMGVSYWEIGQHDKAVAMTQRGIKWMEQAVKQGALESSALLVPYGNLAAMHRNLGANDKAEHYQELAGRVKSEKLK